MAKADDLKAKLGLDDTPVSPVPVPPPDVPDHDMIRCIGQGSYGEVWLARNAVGTWRAVKVVRRARFKDERPYEREFIGIQKYEPISRTNEGLVDVLQIGRNDTAGYFYYVMELADGLNEPGGMDQRDSRTGAVPFNPQVYVPMTLSRALKQRGHLPMEECIPLGLALSLALGHLHRRGLIHRDVKPSNIIFVNGVPKLADIGLVTELAEAQSFVGTEGFIPPEGPNSPQADLYALGKVLYEASMGKDRQEFPEPRSSLGMDADSQALMELNAVLLRACAISPKERYPTAEAMNADLALLHSGASVKDKHALERRLKLARRITVATVAVMVLGVVPYYLAIKESKRARAAATQEADARKEAQTREREAKEAEAQATAILEFFQRHVLAVARPTGDPNAISRDVTVREALITAERQISNTFSNQPLIEAQLRETMGETFLYLSDAEHALAQLERAYELFRSNLGDEAKHTVAARNNLSLAYGATGQLEKALPLAEALCASLQANPGTNSPQTLVAMHNLALLYHDLGHDDKALPLEHAALAARQVVLSPTHEDTLSSMDGLAIIYRSLGQLSNAIYFGEATLAIARSNLPPDHPMTLSVMGNLASSYQEAKRVQDVLPLRKAVLEARRQVNGPDAPPTLNSMNNLATAYEMAGDLEAAITLNEETLRLRQSKQPPDHPDVLYSMHNLAGAYNRVGRSVEAIALAEKTVELRRKKLAPDHPETLRSMSSLAVFYQDAGQFSNAIPLYEQTLALAETKLGADSPVTLEYLHKLAFAYFEAQQWSNAIPRLQDAVRRFTAQYGPTGPNTGVEVDRLTQAYVRAGQPLEAVRVWREHIEAVKGSPQPNGISVASALAQMVTTMLSQGMAEEAETAARNCLQLREKLMPDDWRTFNTRSQLGGCLLALKKYSDAEPLLLAGFEGMKQRADTIPPAGRPRLREALQRLVRLFEETNRPGQAAQWNAVLAELARSEEKPKPGSP